MVVIDDAIVMNDGESEKALGDNQRRRNGDNQRRCWVTIREGVG